MEGKIQELKNHYIVCGAGEVGRTVIHCLKENQSSFVVIEENEKRFEELEQVGILAIQGNATHEDVLEKAGIERAKGIVCALATDSENVFTVLTARQMNEDIYIVSKAVEFSAHKKLTKAGANNTISPNEIGGQRIAALLLRPLGDLLSGYHHPRGRYDAGFGGGRDSAAVLHRGQKAGRGKDPGADRADYPCFEEKGRREIQVQSRLRRGDPRRGYNGRSGHQRAGRKTGNTG